MAIVQKHCKPNQQLTYTYDEGLKSEQKEAGKDPEQKQGNFL